VDALLGAVSDQVAKTQRNIDALGQVSLRAIDGMNQGALTMGSAAQRFETAGSAVTGVFDRSTQVADALTSTAASLQAASTAVQRGFEQYEAMRESEAEARSHLGQVNEALVKAFSDFGNSLVSQVKSTIAETDRHLAQGTGHLNGVVQELANAVQRMKRA
jgi:phage-related protein